MVWSQWSLPEGGRFLPYIDTQQFSRSVVSDSLWPHGLHARLLCPLPSPRVCLNSCPLSRWCYLTMSSSAALLSFCLQSFPASRFFPMSQLFAPGGQRYGALASASALPMNIQSWFPLGLTGLILQSKGLSRIFSSTTIWKHQFFSAQPCLWSKSQFCTWLLEKPIQSIGSQTVRHYWATEHIGGTQGWVFDPFQVNERVWVSGLIKQSLVWGCESGIAMTIV